MLHPLRSGALSEIGHSIGILVIHRGFPMLVRIDGSELERLMADRDCILESSLDDK